MAHADEPHMPTPDEIKARCAEIQSEWTIRDRLSRGKVTLNTRSPSEYLNQPRRRAKQRQSHGVGCQDRDV